MSAVTTTRTRSGGDLVLGALVTAIGLVVLGNAVVATRVSIQFLGWMLVFAGILALAAAIFSVLRSGKSGFSGIGGAACLVVGLVCLRNVEAAAVTLTLIVGALYLMTGVARLVAAAGADDRRWPLLVAGAVSTALGLVVLLNVLDASYSLLGVLLGIQIVVEGLTMILVGRLTVEVAPPEQTHSP